jgi:hypothetical protein
MATLDLMQMELPAQAIIAIATIVAALIAGLISFVNLTLSKEQKTSEFRQAWIDGLREDLSNYMSALRAVARAEEIAYTPPLGVRKTPFPANAEQVVEQRQAISRFLYRIKLRLNPKEAEHIELLRLLGRALDEHLKISATNPTSDKTVETIDLAADYATLVLKTEWERVKSGELPFKIARNWVVPALVVLCLGFVAFLLAGKFKI